MGGKTPWIWLTGAAGTVDLILLEGGPPPDSGTFEGSGAVSGLEPDLEPWGVSSPLLLESGLATPPGPPPPGLEPVGTTLRCRS